MIYSTPVWLLLVNLAIARERVDFKRLALVMLSLSGCAIIVLQGSMGTVGLGYAQIILAAIFWSISIRLIDTHCWYGTVLDALFRQVALAIILCTPIAIVLEGIPKASIFQAVDLWYLIYVGPIATAGGFGLMFFAGRHIAPSTIALSSTIAPLIGAASSAVLLGEQLAPAICICGGLMILSVFLGAEPMRTLRRWFNTH